MRVALCVSGQPREFKKSFASLNKHLISVTEADVFIHTWDYKKSNRQPHFDIEGSWRYPDEGALGEFIELYKPVSYAVEPFGEAEEHKFYNSKYEANKHPHASIVRYLCMLYKIHACHELCINYAKSRGFEYDVIIKGRSDIELHNPLNLKELQRAKSERVLFADVVLPNGLVSDILFFGNSQVMTEVANLYVELDAHFEAGVQFNTEKMLPRHLSEHKITPLTHSIGQVKVLRPPQAVWR